MSPLAKALAWLGVALAAIAGACGGWVAGSMSGRAEGRTLERAAMDRQVLTRVDEMLTQHSGLIEQANTASAALRTATAARAQADAKNLKEFRHALAATSADRAGCVFDDGIVRQFGEAAARAAAAAAGGTAATVPGAAGADAR